MIYISALNKTKSYNMKKIFFSALTELNICDKTNLYNNHSREEGQAGPQSVSWLVMKTKHAQARPDQGNIDNYIQYFD